jgi:hypothetical protein
LSEQPVLQRSVVVEGPDFVGPSYRELCRQIFAMSGFERRIIRDQPSERKQPDNQGEDDPSETRSHVPSKRIYSDRESVLTQKPRLVGLVNPNHSMS